MKKIKAFFAKVKNYVKNTAWIQPLLIVVVIFVVLFSLGPITEGIKTAWTNITTVNNMEKITFEEYVEKVEKQEVGEQRDFIVVFTQKGCEHCPSFYKSMNNYLKNGHKSADFDIFYVDLSVKSTKIKLDGTKYTQYKDTSCGLVAPAGNTNEKIQSLDYIYQLDLRIGEFNKSFGETSYTDLTENTDPTVSGYSFVFTPLIIWYQNGVESRISNTYTNTSYLTKDADGIVRPTSFKQYIQDFGGETDNSVKADEWNNQFDLKANTAKLKDAYNAL
ncbi:MAG: hypothetical protein IJD46_00715 [Bacilli bacterium]|nr:hypothetical protein [Bacilli bacterium]